MAQNAPVQAGTPLPADQLAAVCGLLESMLSPLDRKLALAPIDDEPLTPEDAAATRAAIASLEKNGGVPMEDVLADFGHERNLVAAPREPHRAIRRGTAHGPETGRDRQRAGGVADGGQ